MSRPFAVVLAEPLPESTLRSSFTLKASWFPIPGTRGSDPRTAVMPLETLELRDMSQSHGSNLASLVSLKQELQFRRSGKLGNLEQDDNLF